MRSTTRRVALTYGLTAVLLWPLPLVQVLHVESAAVVATVGFFAGGWAALRECAHGTSVAHVAAQQLALLALPALLLTVSMAWAPNCGYLEGLLLYAVFTIPSVLLGVALGFALGGTTWQHPLRMLGGLGVGLMVAGPVYDLGFHPQFYTYNHVFGGVLGPIYDEQLAIRAGLFFFRGLTMLWAALLVGVGLRLRGRLGGWRRACVPALALCIGAVYYAAPALGINTTPAVLRNALGGHVQTRHIDLYYDPADLSRPAAQRLAREHAFQLARLGRRLNLSLDRWQGAHRIQSYIYPSPAAKAQLVGARYTSVAPVWLAQPQIHVLDAYVDATLGHELAHVVARPFGLPLLKATWAVGLVEGWAVALEPPSGRPSVHDQMVAQLAERSPEAWAADVAARLSPWGFWTGRGAVSYTATGSFVAFLLQRYGAARLKRVYARANVAAVYGQPATALAQEWAQFLAQRRLVTRAAHDLVTRRFARPSLFETPCPHYVPPYRRRYQDATAALDRGDTTQARRALNASLRLAPRFLPARTLWARLLLHDGQVAPVYAALDTIATAHHTLATRYLLGDATALRQQPDTARAHYTAALQRVPRYAYALRSRIALRRALAHRPALLRALQRPGRVPPRDTTEALGRLWAGLGALDAGHPARALAAWEGLSPPFLAPSAPPALRAVIRHQWTVWQARALRGAGRAPAALPLWTQARREAQFWGDRPRTAFLALEHARTRFQMEHPLPATASHP
ncbi:hypothetical protein [Salisaeta longa]|uniref:hypothetical protein n=1 Tax=Salisaeta longa TaxID=503170 RepID=UPI0003B74227|nr:hypothetical protein [Salisaeta longa]